MYVVNMSGKGLRYWICKIPTTEFAKFETLHEKFDEDYENLFFDLTILKKFGYSSWDELFCIDSGRGFLINARNTIEIKKKSKKIRKFDSTELLYSPLMFDPYSVNTNESVLEKEDGFVYVALIQYELGSFFKFKLEELNFDINKFEFQINYKPISTLLKLDFVTDLKYDNQSLIQKKEDVVNSGNKVLFL